jgi:hypothetical protein
MESHNDNRHGLLVASLTYNKLIIRVGQVNPFGAVFCSRMYGGLIRYIDRTIQCGIEHEQSKRMETQDVRSPIYTYFHDGDAWYVAVLPQGDVWPLVWFCWFWLLVSPGAGARKYKR